jgi:23S rRNA (cytidine1920-2'-O)/16S rRNA (cytidine1409-2'-O)-methyltransferase
MAGLVFSGERKIDKAGQPLAPTRRSRCGGGASLGVARRDQACPCAGAFRLGRDGAVALDVGSSTGGFTDVLLQKGAAKVFAVDVGTNQLAWKLRQDPRVVVHEQTNARYLTARSSPSRSTSSSATQASSASPRCSTPRSTSPSPAAACSRWSSRSSRRSGRDRQGRRGARPGGARARLRRRRRLGASRGWTVEGLVQSPITGPEGNVEFLLAARRKGRGGA